MYPKDFIPCYKDICLSVFMHMPSCIFLKLLILKLHDLWWASLITLKDLVTRKQSRMLFQYVVFRFLPCSNMEAFIIYLFRVDMSCLDTLELLLFIIYKCLLFQSCSGTENTVYLQPWIYQERKEVILSFSSRESPCSNKKKAYDSLLMSYLSQAVIRKTQGHLAYKMNNNSSSKTKV